MTSKAIIQIQCSSSSSHPMRPYDVFVSFRGEDTRNNFTAFLFDALCRKGIHAFRDDQHIRKGEFIAPELLQAISGSRIFIVVFSKDYASSTWCLRELEHICNCIQTRHRRVLPIFYDVDPSDVLKQSGCYEEAFAKHERFRENKEKMEEVQRWRETLTRVANLSGWDIGNKPQHAEIEKIVQEIANVLGPKFLCLPNNNLVGMESRVEELEKLLRLELANDVRVVGISGMGGIGKTTLGCAVYERICHQYDLCCYIEDVSKIYRDSSRSGVQNQLLSQALKEKDLEICNASEGTWLSWTRLRHASALIVLDNVDKIEQLEMFTGSRDTLLRECLGGGSRIIIISRDQHLLRTHGVDDVYQVQELNNYDAVRLFCKNAFKSHSLMSDFEKLTRKVLLHANGHQLAIKVLGSSLYGRDVLHWRSALARLRENKDKSIMDVLRISFDQLEDTEKEIFLDIACFYLNSSMHVKNILNIRGFHPEHGLPVLADKSLITMEQNMVKMHSLLRDLGKSIVREKSPKNPRKWSRLWDLEDLYKVLSDNTPAENVEVEAIVCYGQRFTKKVKADALSKMSHLKLLILRGVEFSGAIENLSNELGYLEWHKYPFKCLPQSFKPDNLVELKLQYSNIKQLWEGKKPLHNLKRLDLSYSENLIEMPYLGEAPKLEVLHLRGCKQLTKIDPSIGVLRKLTILNLKECKNLVSLPNNILGLNSLKYLDLSGCSKLYSIQSLDEQRDSKYWKKLYIGGVPVPVPIYSESASSYFKAHKDSVTSLPLFPCIRVIILRFCNLVKIPEAIGSLCSLEYLYLSGNNFCTLPNLNKLSKLLRLDLQHCKHLKCLPELPSRIDFRSTTFVPYGKAGLYIFNCPELVGREHSTSMAFSWFIRILQYVVQPPKKIVNDRIGSVTPGSEIPRWFNNQHVNRGSYISIDASPVMHDKTWVGVMCCVVFKIGHKCGIQHVHRGSYISIDASPVNTYISLYIDENEFVSESVADIPEHMYTFFVERSQFMRRPNNQGCMKFNCWTTYQRHVEVKKYGYGWVYEQDAELLNLTMMHSANSSARKRKFWGIEEKEGKRRKGSMWAKLRKDDDANSSLENRIMLLQNQFQNLGLHNHP